MNKVILVGNLGSDPELRQTQTGLSILKMRVATNSRVKEGETWVDRTEWSDVVMFGKRAEGLAKFLTKGSTVAVEGELRTTSYEKDGTKRYRTEVIANDVNPIGGKREGAARTEPKGKPASDYPGDWDTTPGI